MLRAVIRHAGEGAWHDGKRHLLAVAAQRAFLAHARLPDRGQGLIPGPNERRHGLV
jgi:hypothetical protein